MTDSQARGAISTVSTNDPLEEQAVELVAEALPAILNRPGTPVTEGMRFRARQIVRRLRRSALLRTASDNTSITLDRAKAIEIRNQLRYMHDRLGVERGGIIAMADHLTELIDQQPGYAAGKMQGT